MFTVQVHRSSRFVELYWETTCEYPRSTLPDSHLFYSSFHGVDTRSDSMT